MIIDVLLERLDGVKRTGKGKYISRCPAHNDKTPSLSVNVIPDGRILIHCHTGCAPGDVMNSVGLSLSNLFPDGAINSHLYGATPWLRKQQKTAKKKLENERLILDMADEMRARGEQLSRGDLQRERQAYESVRGHT